MNLKLNLARGIKVDTEDLYLLQQYLFHVTDKGYAATTIGGKYVKLHKLIMPDDEQVDHRNHDGLDNRRTNLRYATLGEQARNKRKYSNNSSGFKGVSQNNTNWCALIRVDGKRIHLGTFITKEEAARVYDAAAKKFHGEFAYINFPD